MNNFSSWFKHPSYFFFWLFVGLFCWSFSFQPTDLEPKREVSAYKESEVAQLPTDLQSIDSQKNVAAAASQADEEMNFVNAVKELEAQNEKISEDAEPLNFVYSEEEIEDYLDNAEGVLDKSEADTEAFRAQRKQFRFDTVSAEDLNFFVTPEDAKSCGKERNYIENLINNNPKVAAWAEDRKQESPKLSKKCIAFVMNSFPELRTKAEAVSFKSRESQMFATCPRGSSGGPALKGGKRIKHPVPCVSKNLVNMTYNAYVDVMECLHIEPKDLLPKIYTESGFYINALGGGMDGGIGQLTQSAIEQVNIVYPKYMEEIMKAASAEPGGACARILKSKSMITPVKADASYRCGLLWPTENPLRNILYAGMLTRYNMKYVAGLYLDGKDEVIVEGGAKALVTGKPEQFAGKFREFDILKKLEQLGVKNPNLLQFQKMITLAGYNAGVGSAMNVFNSYLEQRIAANAKSKSNKYNLKPSDFDFVETIPAVKEARSYLLSGSIKPGLSAKDKAEKVKKRKQLPSVWANAYTRTFPEYIALRLNTYKGGSGKFQIYGVPGYLTSIAEKNKMFRDTFQAGGENPNYCSSPQFLNVK